MSQRIDRVDELIRQEIGAILAKEVQDPHIGFATVTDVETTPDLRHAKVWVSVIGGAPERRETLAALERAMGYVRHELGTRLRLRRIPQLHVALDESAERGTRVLRILDELGHGDISGGEAIIDAPRAELLPTPVPRLPREGDAPEPPPDAVPGVPPAAPETSGAPPARDARRRLGRDARSVPGRADGRSGRPPGRSGPRPRRGRAT